MELTQRELQIIGHALQVKIEQKQAGHDQGIFEDNEIMAILGKVSGKILANARAERKLAQ